MLKMSEGNSNFRNSDEIENKRVEFVNGSGLFEENFNLSASARLIYQLGEQLIENELVALVELIKNAYDADTTLVNITVDTQIETEYGKGKIIIEDNGNGMLASIFQGSFLKLSTAFKKENIFSPCFKRRVLGEKGLGRLSIQRLGKYVEITTSPRIEYLKGFIKEKDIEINKSYNVFKTKIDWNQFLDTSLDLYDIQTQFAYYKENNPRYGTRLEISGIRNLDYWGMSKSLENSLRTEIFGMINPFSQDRIDKFNVNMSVDGYKITNEIVSEDLIKLVSDVVVKIRFRNWVLSGTVFFKRKYFQRQVESTIEDMYRDGFDCVSSPDEYIDTCIRFRIDFKDDDWKINFPKYKDVEFHKTNSRNDYANPGDFKGRIYAINLSEKKEILNLVNTIDWGMEIKNAAQFRSIWNATNGIYLFRNSFRILPYGRETDLLDFAKIYRMVKRNIFSIQTAAGYIDLDSSTTETLAEQTNRQGLIRDEYGENFFKIIRDILAPIITSADVDFRGGFDINPTLLVSDGKSILTKNKLLEFKKIVFEQKLQTDTIINIGQEASSLQYSLALKKVDPDSLLKKLFPNDEYSLIIDSKDPVIQILITAIRDSANIGGDIDSHVQKIVDRTNELKEIEQQISQKYKQEKYIQSKKIEQLESMASLAGQGIIVESLTHELNRIEQNINGYAAKTKKLLNDYKKSNTSQELSITDAINNQDSIVHETLYLKQQLLHLEPTYRQNKMKFESFDLKTFFKEIYISDSPMSYKANKADVKVIIAGAETIVFCNKGILITIFDNLFLNSLYWVNGFTNKTINFRIIGNGQIEVWDSGSGINLEIENELFEPYKSMKPDGRGLGLFIVKELIESIKCNIWLNTKERNANNRLYKFNIDLSNILQTN